MELRTLSMFVPLLLPLLAPAQAGATNELFLSLIPNSSDGRVRLQLEMDFDDLVLGGGLDVTFPTDRLIFEQITFAPDLGDDPRFRLAPAPGSERLPIAFGGIPDPPGSRTVAELTFHRYSLPLGVLLFPPFDPDVFVFELAANDRPAGPFLDASGVPLSVSYRGLTVVPEPGSGLLLAGAGLLTVAGSRARR